MRRSLQHAAPPAPGEATVVAVHGWPAAVVVAGDGDFGGARREDGRESGPATGPLPYTYTIRGSLVNVNVYRFAVNVNGPAGGRKEFTARNAWNAEKDGAAMPHGPAHDFARVAR
jgi:hypothetical protein